MALKRGLDVREHVSEIRSAIESLHDQNIQAALFVEPDIEAIEFSKECGADFVEINTGGYSSAVGKTAVDQEISANEAGNPQYDIDLCEQETFDCCTD